MATKHACLHKDAVLFDRKKKRVGIISELAMLKTVATIKWSDGAVSKVTANEFEKVSRHYKAIRLRDFPLTVKLADKTALPIRIRKDEYTLDGTNCQFVRLLDVVAVKELNADMVMAELGDFLPNANAQLQLATEIARSAFRHFSDWEHRYYLVDCTLDRTNPSLYRIRITTVFPLK